MQKPIAELSSKDKQKLLELLEPYYEQPQTLLERELSRNDVIYLEYHKQTLLSFFMVAWERHLLQGDLRDVVYLGLSCTNINYRKSRNASRVYYYFTREASEWERNRGQNLILYGTTATPLMLLTVPKIWAKMRPFPDGSYSQSDGALVDSLKRSIGVDRYSDKHPFVLRKQAEATLYASAEKARQQAIVEKFNLVTFESLRINEAEGDRLLMTCRVPTLQKVQALKKKLFDKLDSGK